MPRSLHFRPSEPCVSARAAALVSLASAALVAAPVMAENGSPEVRAASPLAQSANAQTPSARAGSLAQFAPSASRRDHTIDYSYLDEALGWFVIPMGPSLRETARRVEPELGTRRIYGHESRYRLEGNRVAFSFLTDDIRGSLSAYRADLERIGSTLDLTNIPRNEQLAFWLNLHNVAVLEALAQAYPLREPFEGEFGSNKAPLDDAKLVTVRGVALSPRDIRERIVYPNWSDPKVIYGFWRGEIGGPSIQRLAFTGATVDTLLLLAGEEFVNSLRGVEKYGGALRVSEIYREAAPFYFTDFESDLRGHLSKFAGEKVTKLLADTKRTDFNKYDRALADLSNGERDPSLNFVFVSEGGAIGGNGLTVTEALADARRSRPNLAIQRIMKERAEKLRKAIRRGVRTGQVIYGVGDEFDPTEVKEVE